MAGAVGTVFVLDDDGAAFGQLRCCYEAHLALSSAKAGYLVDTFLQSCSNQRTDKYGVGVDGRFAFLEEIVRCVSRVYPTSRIGVKLAPNSGFNGMGSETNASDFLHYAARLSELGVGYLHVQVGSRVARQLRGPYTSRDITVLSSPLGRRRHQQGGDVVRQGGHAWFPREVPASDPQATQGGVSGRARGERRLQRRDSRGGGRRRRCDRYLIRPAIYGEPSAQRPSERQQQSRRSADAAAAAFRTWRR